MTEKEILEIVRKNPNLIWEIISNDPQQLIEIIEKSKIKLATNKDLKILYHKLKDVLSEKINQRYRELDKKIDEKYEALDKKIEQKYEELNRKIDEKYEALDRKIDQRFNALIITIVIQTIAIIGSLIGIVLTLIQILK
jgi:Skp family chaperone for outer membrane proteins